MAGKSFIYAGGFCHLHFFGKPASQLKLHEAALLVAVLPNPKKLRADAPTDYVRERQAWIIRQAQRLKRTGQLAQLEI